MKKTLMVLAVSGTMMPLTVNMPVYVPPPCHIEQNDWRREGKRKMRKHR